MTLQGVVVFKIDDEDWTLDLSEGTAGALYAGAPKSGDAPDLTLTLSDANFAQLVMGKLNPQQAFLMRKLKISGSMGMAMKLQPILDAAQPKAKM
ncbi:Non-specific lipid-transfer protein [Tetrabaena socialis]|uniref:Non-specific lipid-transfer protein n=1 Tax=Tetrabaena socialis TaxID=47790 RepID=A0A2J7ZZ15_9CHLO|nr:Non-specific lipid-transfer protein [Tetrabaena socialis]PNH05509.1 Non-specific lipid-transfer protein [Tetrabaena socialis]|eukprot:PNH05507.1 Non-specific lipid-transfer protein [Tetrabaena socialis]